ncbi:MAG: chloride channel protein [Bacteroidales bacterium]|nr:chloride channel protein [Bacteroidales bacterium]
MKNKLKNLRRRLYVIRMRHISPKNFIMILSALIGVIVGIAAVIIKNAVHYTQYGVEKIVTTFNLNFLYFLLPIVGLGLTIVFIKYILKRPVGHGIPSVLYALSKTNGKIRSNNMFSSVITSALTVGFGGSVGLEGPTVATGAAFGSNIGIAMRLDYKQLIILLGAATAAAMAAIFKAPIAAVVFALEVIMIDLTVASVVPLLIASATAALTSMFFLGVGTIYPVQIIETYKMSELPYYIILGVLSGLLAVYFTRVYMYITSTFDAMGNVWKRLFIGGSLLGLIIFFFPSIYGEGFEGINLALEGRTEHIFANTIYNNLDGDFLFTIGFILLVLLFKVIATSLTFGAGGVGGIFAPSLFLGSNLGLWFVLIINHFKIASLNGSHFALAGMAGLIAANLHAPLTAIFLIGDLTGGYQMFIPLMIVSVIAYSTVKIFQPNSVYTIQLAKRGELRTHNSDTNILSMMTINKVIERDFLTVNKNQTLGQLVTVIAKSQRNIFPVVDMDNNFEGVIAMDNVREIMFDRELYDTTLVSDLMYCNIEVINMDDKMNHIAEKFHKSSNYNIPVVDNGKYVGFVSRANVFSTYRKMLKYFAED